MNLMMTPTRKPVKSCCSSGKRERNVYDYKPVEGFDLPRRYVSSTYDFQDYIQQSKDDLDLALLGKALVAHKDNIQAHFRTEGKDIDLTGLPRDLREYDELTNKMIGEFKQLPKDLRDLFGDDFKQYRKAWEKGTMRGVLETYVKSKAKPAPSEGDK